MHTCSGPLIIEAQDQLSTPIWPQCMESAAAVCAAQAPAGLVIRQVRLPPWKALLGGPFELQRRLQCLLCRRWACVLTGPCSVDFQLCPKYVLQPRFCHPPEAHALSRISSLLMLACNTAEAGAVDAWHCAVAHRLQHRQRRGLGQTRRLGQPRKGTAHGFPPSSGSAPSVLFVYFWKVLQLQVLQHLGLGFGVQSRCASRTACGPPSFRHSIWKHCPQPCSGPPWK